MKCTFYTPCCRPDTFTLFVLHFNNQPSRYKLPRIKSVNMTWGVEGRSLAVEGEGFVNVPLLLCKYRGDRGKPLRGEFFSSRLVTCPLGSSLQNDATGEVEKVQLYISMDEGERWSNAIDFYHDAKIRWYTGLEVSCFINQFHPLFRYFTRTPNSTLRFVEYY